MMAAFHSGRASDPSDTQGKMRQGERAQESTVPSCRRTAGSMRIRGNHVPCILFRKAELRDAHVLGGRLCPADAREASLATGLSPEKALIQSFRHTQEAGGPCLTCEIDGSPELLFGVCPKEDGRGMIWMLHSEIPSRWETLFARYSRRVLQALWLQSRCRVLENFVHEDNTLAIRWLEWLGFHVEAQGRWRHFVMVKPEVLDGKQGCGGRSEAFLQNFSRGKRTPPSLQRERGEEVSGIRQAIPARRMAEQGGDVWLS